MTLPDDRPKGTARERFRNILSAEQDDESARNARKPAIVNLPRPQVEGGQPAEAVDATGPALAERLPGQSSRLRIFQGFWTMGAILSFIANAVLLGMLLRGGGAATTGGTLASVYSSLEQLDNAHLRTTIPVQSSLTLDGNIPVNTATRITLSRDLLVRGAHVTINSAGLSIDSPADITLPAGTELDASLDMLLPLNSQLPITLAVPVDISVRETELHDGIQSLKEALRPLVCATVPAAALNDGTPICR